MTFEQLDYETQNALEQLYKCFTNLKNTPNELPQGQAEKKVFTLDHTNVYTKFNYSASDDQPHSDQPPKYQNLFSIPYTNPTSATASLFNTRNQSRVESKMQSLNNSFEYDENGDGNSVVHTKQSVSKQRKCWSDEEHKLFLQGIMMYGKNKPTKIAQHVKTRQVMQVISHSQKFYQKVDRIYKNTHNVQQILSDDIKKQIQTYMQEKYNIVAKQILCCQNEQFIYDKSSQCVHLHKKLYDIHQETVNKFYEVNSEINLVNLSLKYMAERMSVPEQCICSCLLIE